VSASLADGTHCRYRAHFHADAERSRAPESYRLIPDADWLRAPSTVSIADSGGIVVSLRSAALRAPGVHSAAVEGWGADSLGTRVPPGRHRGDSAPVAARQRPDPLPSGRRGAGAGAVLADSGRDPVASPIRGAPRYSRFCTSPAACHSGAARRKSAADTSRANSSSMAAMCNGRSTELDSDGRPSAGVDAMVEIDPRRCA
jgi:hypothetical protein